MARDYYGFGMKPDCFNCDVDQYWKGHSEVSTQLATDFIFGKVSPYCLTVGNLCQVKYGNLLSDIILRSIQSITYQELIRILDDTSIKVDVSTVPLFNDIDDATSNMIRYMVTVDESTFLDAGTYFTDEINRVEARRKYGEEHLKLAAQFGFVSLPVDRMPRIACITPFGIRCGFLDNQEFESLLAKLIFRIPIIAELFKRSKFESVSVSGFMRELGMKESTISRRTTSVKALFKLFNKVNDETISERISNIYW